MFSDLSPLFLSRAEQEFGAFDTLRTQKLDLERDPLQQGLLPGTFDLIVAANCVHATADLSATLRGLQTLLAPGGALLLLEGTRKQPWIDLTFGLTDGWWRFADTTLRASYPLLDRERWGRLLGDLGFDAIASAPGADASAALAENILVMARAPQTKLQAAADRWIVLADQRVSPGLTAALRASGASVSLVIPEGAPSVAADETRIRPTELEDYRRLIATGTGDDRPLRGIVHLWSLSAVPPDGQSADQVLDAQSLGARSVLHLTRAVAEAGMPLPPRVWVATSRALPATAGAAEGLVHAPLWGLGKVIELEHPDLRASVIDVDASDDVPLQIAREVLADAEEREVAYRNGQRRVARLARTRPTADPIAEELVLIRPGSPDGLRIQPMSRRRPGRGEVEICVAATGLNFRDVLITLGMYPDPGAQLGGECAGWVSAVGEGVVDFTIGDAVVALASRSFATHVIADTCLVFALPRRLDFSGAATISAPS